MSQNSANLSLEQQEQFLETIRTTSFIMDKGQLDVCAFARYLAEALYADGFKKEACFGALQYFFDIPTQKNYNDRLAYEVHIKDMDETMFHLYPNGKTIYFSPQFLIDQIHRIVSEIGTKLLKIEHAKTDTLYSWWIKREHVFTLSLFDKLFKDFSIFIEKNNSDYRHIIVHLHLGVSNSRIKNQSSEVRVELEKIIEKDQRLLVAQKKIEHAIKEEFFLEAIALLESCISDRLSLLLYLHKKKVKSKSFSNLIEMAKKVIPDMLLEALNAWRSDRNKCIHNMVRFSPFEDLPCWNELEEYAHKTADEGLEILVSLNEWFEDYVVLILNPYRFHLPASQRFDS